MKKIISILKRRFCNKSVQAEEKNPEITTEYLNPMECGKFDAEIGGWYNKAAGELFDGFKIDQNDIVLDVGCGGGMKSHFCAMRGAHIIFADIKAEHVASTKHQLEQTPAKSIHGFVSDSNPLPLKNETATKIISTEVVEHVADPQQYINELVRVGKPGAQYLITVPHPISENLQKTFAPDSYFEHPNHIRILERKDFEDLITNAGLNIEKYTQHGFYWSLWWLFFWNCDKQGYTAPWNPLLENWSNTWQTLLKSKDGVRLKKALDEVIPKNQIIIARKPF